MKSNRKKLEEVFFMALEDEDFMGNSSKVSKAIEALTPKDTLTAVLKRLQGNARKDFLDKKYSGAAGYDDSTMADKVKEYVSSRFKSYMENPKTTTKATKLFFEAYPVAQLDNSQSAE